MVKKFFISLLFTLVLRGIPLFGDTIYVANQLSFFTIDTTTNGIIDQRPLDLPPGMSACKTWFVCGANNTAYLATQINPLAESQLASINTSSNAMKLNPIFSNLPVPREDATPIATSPDGNFLCAVGSSAEKPADGEIHIANIQKQNTRTVIDRPNTSLHSVAIVKTGPDNFAYITADNGGEATIEIFNLNNPTNKPIGTIDDLGGVELGDLAFTQDGSHLAVINQSARSLLLIKTANHSDRQPFPLNPANNDPLISIATTTTETAASQDVYVASKQELFHVFIPSQGIPELAPPISFGAGGCKRHTKGIAFVSSPSTLFAYLNMEDVGAPGVLPTPAISVMDLQSDRLRGSIWTEPISSTDQASLISSNILIIPDKSQSSQGNDKVKQRRHRAKRRTLR